MRHATAVPRGILKPGQDAARPLTEQGRQEARAVANGLQRIELKIDLILSSPWLRAKETAENVLDVYKGVPELCLCEAMQGDASPQETFNALRAYVEFGIILLVGHEPHLSRLLAELVTQRADLDAVFKKAGVACADSHTRPPQAGSGVLRWLMTRKQLELIGK